MRHKELKAEMARRLDAIDFKTDITAALAEKKKIKDWYIAACKTYNYPVPESWIHKSNQKKWKNRAGTKAADRKKHKKHSSR